MKRRVLIAKALSHEPRILFLDEPTAGVDVELRRDMWEMVRALRESGRDDHPDDPLHRRGRADGRPHRRHQQGRDHPGRGQGRADGEARQEAAHRCSSQSRCAQFPRRSRGYALELAADGTELVYTFDAQREEHAASPRCCASSASCGIDFKDLQTRESSLEDIFVSLVKDKRHEPPRHPRDLRLRDGAHLPHADAEHRVAGHLDVALLRRVRLGDRLAHGARSTASATARSSCPGSRCCRS